VDVGGVRIRVDRAWTHAVDGDTHRFTAPGGEAWFSVDAGTVQTAGMDAATCVQKIRRALGGKLDARTVGGQPAAYGSAVDRDKKGTRFTTDTWVGCDGKTTWSVTGHRLAETEGPGAVQSFVESLTFVKGGK
jgi:hypothetical protein